MEADIHDKIVLTLTPATRRLNNIFMTCFLSIPVRRKVPARSGMMDHIKYYLRPVLALNSSASKKREQDIVRSASEYELQPTLNTKIHSLKPREYNQIWTSTPNLVAPNYFTFPFALR